MAKLSSEKLLVYFALIQTLARIHFIQAQSPHFQTIPVKRLSSCSVEVEGKVLDLSRLERKDDYPRFQVAYQSWNYSFNPCRSYNEPIHPYRNVNTFGDKCLHISVCKFKTVRKRYFSYVLGSQDSASFKAVRNNVKNVTDIVLTFHGIMSMNSKKTHVTLICDKFRVKADDAEFRITVDKTGGDIYAELHHECACPGVCVGASTVIPILLNNSTSDEDDVSMGGASKEKSTSVASNARSLLIVFGINIGLLILAVFIGALCYSKRSALRSYNKLPGLHSHWSGSEKQKKGDKMGISSTPRKGFRDYELVEKKSSFPPILEECEIPIGHLEVKQRLGGNIFGDTYKGHWKDTPVAIKCITHGIQLSENHSQVVTKIKEEVSVLSKARHKNIAAMIGMCLEGKFPYIVNQLVNGDSVKHYLKNEEYISWTQKLRMCTQAADGMTFLHSIKPNPVLHRDLRCANLMITPEEVVVVVDFGVTTIIQPVRQECRKEKCFCQKELSACPPSIRWTAPEILVQSDKRQYPLFTPSCDVYSFGMLMYEMMKGDNPFSEIQAELEIMEIVNAGGRPVIPTDIVIPAKYKDLIREFWDSEPSKRPTFKQVVSELKEAMSEARHLEKHNHHLRQATPSTSRTSTPVPFVV